MEESWTDWMAWLHRQRHTIVNVLLGITLVVGALGVLASIVQLITGAGRVTLLVGYTTAYALILLLFALRRLRDEWRVVGFLAIVCAFSIFALRSGWLSSNGRPFLVAFTVICAILLGHRAGFAAAAASLLIYAGFGLAYNQGWLALPPLGNPTNPAVMAVEGVGFALALALAVASQWFFKQALVTATDATRAAHEARRLSGERAVELETANRLLAERARALAASAEIARDATSMVEPQELLSRVAALMAERFGLGHAAIFLLDETRGHAVLRAAASGPDVSPLLPGCKVAVAGPGLIGQAIQTGRPRAVHDQPIGVVPAKASELSGMRSELVLPLRSRAEIIGVLDLHAEQPGVFDDDLVSVLQTLADQVATAISNAQLYEQLQDRLQAERRRYDEQSRQAWAEFFQAQPGLAARYDPEGLLPAAGLAWEAAGQAMARGEPVVSGDGPLPGLAVPIKIRDQVIGVVDAFKPPAAGWSAGEVAIVQALIDQLGLALDGARLYRDTQQRAARERLVGEVTARMREALDIETVLRTAALQIGEALSLRDVTIRLDTGGDGSA